MNYSVGRGSPYMGKTFQMWDVRRWKVLMRGRKDEESQHVTLIILFVKSVKKTFLTCIFVVKEL